MLRIRGNGGGTVEKPLEFVKASSRLGPHDREFRRTSSPRIADHDVKHAVNPARALIGHVVVVDLKSTYVCLGTLVACDGQYLEMRDADLHDFRDSTATREVYTYDSVRLGIRRNRARTLIRQDDVVAISRFDEIAES